MAYSEMSREISVADSERVPTSERKGSEQCMISDTQILQLELEQDMRLTIPGDSRKVLDSNSNV